MATVREGEGGRLGLGRSGRGESVGNSVSRGRGGGNQEGSRKREIMFALSIHPTIQGTVEVK